MARKRKSGGSAVIETAGELTAAIEERLDAQGNDGEEAAAPSEEIPDGSPAREDGTDGEPFEPPSSPTPPSPIDRIRRDLTECTTKYHAAEQWHNAVSLQLYAAEVTVKGLRKERETAIERLSQLRNELDYLTAREKDVHDGPAGLFEAEVAREWREFELSAAGIDGEAARLLTEAGVDTLGKIAETTLTDVHGIGPETAAKIADLMATFFAANARYARDAGIGGEPGKAPARVKIKGRVECGDGDALEDGAEYDVCSYVDGVATVELDNHAVAEVPFGSYSVLEWRTVDEAERRQDEAF